MNTQQNNDNEELKKNLKEEKTTEDDHDKNLKGRQRRDQKMVKSSAESTTIN